MAPSHTLNTSYPWFVFASHFVSAFASPTRCSSGAELSTGNCMMFAAWASGRFPSRDIRRNLLISYAANAVGALALVLLVAGSGLLQTGHGRVAVAIAEAKMNLGFEQAFFRGVLCNALVCVAVWLILAGRTIPSKLAGLILPISAFITLGFEHSIANFYLLPAGLMAGAAGSLGNACANMLAVTLGIHVTVEVTAGQAPIDDLDGGDLDDAVTELGIETRGLGVDDQLAHSGNGKQATGDRLNQRRSGA